eukprot:6181785-Pleurochrysis_carterae.AAC.2
MFVLRASSCVECALRLEVPDACCPILPAVRCEDLLLEQLEREHWVAVRHERVRERRRGVGALRRRRLAAPQARGAAAAAAPQTAEVPAPKRRVH